MKITDEMVNAADSVLSRVRPGINDGQIRLALEAAFAVRVKYTREQINEMIGRGEMFVDINPEADWIAAAEMACPHCGGSGHKDDVRPLSASPTRRPMDGWDHEAARIGRAAMDRMQALDLIDETTEDVDFVIEQIGKLGLSVSPAGPFEMRHEEGGYVEFLNEEVPTVVREIDGRVAILKTLEQPRKVVGYRVYDPGCSPSEVFGSASPAGAVKPLQCRVQPWMMACFGPEISADKLERSDRFIEEALELVQSGDYPKERVLALVDYVYGREKGEMPQEVGGVMITLAAFCLAHDIDMHEAGETELARIWTKVEKIRAKHAAKPTGSALPVAARIMSAIEPAGVGVETVRHKKRGTTYEVIGVGKMQAESWTEEVLGADEDGRNAWVNQSIDMREVTIYRSTDDGQIWVRPVEEFNDGRFERAALKGDEQ